MSRSAFLKAMRGKEKERLRVTYKNEKKLQIAECVKESIDSISTAINLLYTEKLSFTINRFGEFSIFPFYDYDYISNINNQQRMYISIDRFHEKIIFKRKEKGNNGFIKVNKRISERLLTDIDNIDGFKILNVEDRYNNHNYSFFSAFNVFEATIEIRNIKKTLENGNFQMIMLRLIEEVFELNKDEEIAN